MLLEPPKVPVPARVSRCVRFGDDFELDFDAYKLRRSGRVLKLERIPMEVLLYLVEQRGELVTREQIVERIWGKDVFLDTDNSINGAISKIRQGLRDDPEQPKFVQTITGKGYRFIAPVIVPAAIIAPASVPPEIVPPAVVSPAIDAPVTEGNPPPQPAGQPPLPPPEKTAQRRPAMRWPLAAAALAVVLSACLTAYVLWSRSGAQPAEPAGRVMLAVLPFSNLTGDPGQEYFSDGMTEEMISELGRLNPQHLGVIGRTSVMLYKRDPKSLDQVGRELGVQYVIEGSVRRDSDHVRITAQLIQVKDQTHVWARQYDRELKNLLAVQGEIAQEIADEIELILGDPHRVNARRAVAPTATTSYEAYDIYLKGRYFWNKRTGEGFRQAADCFQQAIAKDPNYARAYAGLADTFALMSTWRQVPQNEFMPKARAAALRALQIDDSLAEAHTSLALIAENYDYDWQTAEKEFRRSIQLDPGYATAHQWFAEYLSWRGRFDEALAESERALQLDPLSLIIATDRGTIFYYSRQYDRAIEQYRGVLDMDSKFPARALLIDAYVEEGKFREAQEDIEGWQNLDKSAWGWAEKAYLYGRWGRTTEAQHALAKFEELAGQLQPDRTQAALTAYLGVGRNDEAIALLQKAYAEHSNVVTNIKVGPRYNSLHSDPRFQDLLRRLGL